MNSTTPERIRPFNLDGLKLPPSYGHEDLDKSLAAVKHLQGDANAAAEAVETARKGLEGVAANDVRTEAAAIRAGKEPPERQLPAAQAEVERLNHDLAVKQHLLKLELSDHVARLQGTADLFADKLAAARRQFMDALQSLEDADADLCLAEGLMIHALTGGKHFPTNRHGHRIAGFADVLSIRNIVLKARELLAAAEAERTDGENDFAVAPPTS